MSSISISSQCQCAAVEAVVRNLHPVLFTASSAQRACTDGRVPPKQAFRSAYGLSKSSTTEPGCHALPFENLEAAYNSSFSSSSCYGSLISVRPAGRVHPAAGSGGHGLGRVSGAVDGSSRGDSAEFQGGSAVEQMQRRGFVSVISSWVVLLALVNAGAAFGAAAAEDDEQAPESSTAAAPPAKTLVERLLERSKANKAKYDQERLDAYYRRNFNDYFDFLKGGIRNKDEDKLTEAEKGILRWLEKNK